MTALAFTWTDDGTFRPLRQFARKADADFVVGLTYILVPVEQRSAKAHARYFASINDAWQSLPDHVRDEYPSPEALRKRALIKAGYATMTDFAARSSVMPSRGNRFGRYSAHRQDEAPGRRAYRREGQGSRLSEARAATGTRIGAGAEVVCLETGCRQRLAARHGTALHYTAPHHT